MNEATEHPIQLHAASGRTASRRYASPQAVAALIDDRPPDGVFGVHRDVFRDPELFDHEMRHIFEKTWVFVGLESQIPKAFDYLTTWIGRQPVVVMRNERGAIGCFINSCRHRGALVCQHESGNRKFHVCPYHGWVYDSSGRNVDVKDHAHGCYPPSFDAQSHDLVSVARFANYRGFMFASLSADVPPILDHLGGARAFLDLFIDQGSEGLEIVPGRLTFTFDANWKTQIENATDSYHFSTTHASYLGILDRQGKREAERTSEAGSPSAYRQIGKQQKLARGVFDFGQGHSAFWGEVPHPEMRPLHLDIDQLTRRVGETRARWMFYTRNMTVFPNLQISENIAPQLRIIRPLSFDRTEMTTYCIGPKGESKQARKLRLRHYGEFFNPTGLATPDDMAMYQACQQGFEGRTIGWQQAYVRGMGVLQTGPSPQAQELGIEPKSWLVGTVQMGDETAQQPAYREWRRLIVQGLESEATS